MPQTEQLVDCSLAQAADFEKRLIALLAVRAASPAREIFTDNLVAEKLSGVVGTFGSYLSPPARFCLGGLR